MKSLLCLAAAAAVLTSSLHAAHFGHHDHSRSIRAPHHSHHRDDAARWVIPLVVGGVIGYALSEPRRESVTYLYGVQNPPPPSPLYEERWAYFGDCDCQRRTLVRVR